ncbi:MAG TPA: hypothetical protein VGO62_09405 [Myxococcota bacterium]|jgi:hypothetical protein
MTRLCALTLVLLASACPSSPSEGEGEGEGACFGDEAAEHSVDDCATIPASACGPESSNTAVHTCRVASACADLTTPTNSCFDIKACADADAEDVCNDADAACGSVEDPGFPLDTCLGDLIPLNQAFHDAWSDCFNQNPTIPCAEIEDQCYNFATNQLVGG